MPFPTYAIATEITSGRLAEGALHAEIVAAGPYTTNFLGVNATGTDVTILFDAPPSLADQTTITSVVRVHRGNRRPVGNAETLLRSADGSVFAVRVDNAGNLTTTKL